MKICRKLMIHTRKTKIWLGEKLFKTFYCQRAYLFLFLVAVRDEIGS